jgi:flagellar hook-associated protein 2
VLLTLSCGVNLSAGLPITGSGLSEDGWVAPEIRLIHEAYSVFKLLTSNDNEWWRISQELKMATISSAGIGSGLDVNSIVSQLVALEKQPLKTLEVKATTVKAQISAFGDIQSQFAALTDVASRLSLASAWSARNASSSNTSVATITTSATAAATTFSLAVDQLALKQSVSTAALSPGVPLGEGVMTLQLGSWSADGAAFTAGTSSSVDIAVSGTDTISTIAANINSANAGVVATVFNDGTNERLLLQSKATGTAAGFRMTVAEAGGTPTNNDNAGLSQLAFDPATVDPVTSLKSGMATAGIPVQYSQDAKARINGLDVTSTTNTLKDNLPGVTINLLAETTTTPVTMSISEDVTLAVKNVNEFVEAYNKLNKSLSEMTKYDAATKTAGLFQGDSAVVGLQNVLRGILSSTSMGTSLQRLSDIGLERKLDGSMTINTAKLSTAANSGTGLQQLFTNDNGDSMTNGFALKLKTLGLGVAASGGSVSNKMTTLRQILDDNANSQTKVNEKAAAFETRLRTRYSALDAQMASLSALNAYVSQQVTLWNKSTA